MSAPLPADEQLLADMREHASFWELKAVDFLDRNGRHALKKGNYEKIRLTFHDGKIFVLPRRLERHFDKQEFKLRKSRDDA